MLSWLTVQVGRMRQWWTVTRYRISLSPGIYGTLIRIYDWFMTTKDVEMIVAKNKLKRYKFKVGDNVVISSSQRVGIILARWRNQWGQTLYQCGMLNAKWVCLFYEWEIKKTKARIRSEIEIEELDFDLLGEGTWTWKIVTHYSQFASAYRSVRPTTSLRASYMRQKH